MMGRDEPEEDELVLGSESMQPEKEQRPTRAEPAPRVASGGGTLFERMSNLTRGTKNEDEGKDADQGSRDPLDIPRFLNRQNNQ